MSASSTGVTTKITVHVEQRHIDEARREEAENGKRPESGPIARAVREAVQVVDISHDRSWTYRGKPRPGLWLCVRKGEDVLLPSACDSFMYEFDQKDGKPKPFSFDVEL